jgi:hypothetical protein
MHTLQRIVLTSASLLLLSLSAAQGAAAQEGTAVTVYWHMADDADVYLNGVPLRRYEPSFETRGDEAPKPAFSAPAVLKDGDVFTVGGRRGGSYGLMLIAVDSSNRVVFQTNQEAWKVYTPGKRPDWFQPAVAQASPTKAVTIQPDPWYPQKTLNGQYGNSAKSIWGTPGDRFAYLMGVVSGVGAGATAIPPSGSGIAVTVYWHMADDADVYLNGVPLRRYEPSFETRGDEAPKPAFSAPAVLKDGDVFTVGGRRGGSYGLMLIAVDSSNRVVFKTNKEAWKVYSPGKRPDWFQPEVAKASPCTVVTVQPDPWYPQKTLNGQYGNSALSIWGSPGDRFAYLVGIVSMP